MTARGGRPIGARPHTTHALDALDGRMVATRGEVDGVPALRWGQADRTRLATVRQLDALGLRPGGSQPVAMLVFGHRSAYRREVEHAPLYAIDRAVPKRPMTPARHAALDRARAAKRTCADCGTDTGRYLPVDDRRCDPCAITAGTDDPRARTVDARVLDEARARSADVWDTPGAGDAHRHQAAAALAAPPASSAVIPAQRSRTDHDHEHAVSEVEQIDTAIGRAASAVARATGRTAAALVEREHRTRADHTGHASGPEQARDRDGGITR